MFFNKSKKLLAEKEIELSELKKHFEEITNELSQVKESLNYCEETRKNLENHYSEIISIDLEITKRNAVLKSKELNLAKLDEKYKKSHEIYKRLVHEISLATDTIDIGTFGLYERQFNLEDPEKYKIAIGENYKKQKQLIKDKLAAICKTQWTVNGRKREGSRMTNQQTKLMLYAFNGECDSLIMKAKWNNVTKIEEQIRKIFNDINKLGESSHIEITNEFLEEKINELKLVYEFALQKYEEKEEQRLLREQQREEEKAQREFEREQRDAELEEFRYQKALEKAKQDLLRSNHSNENLLNDRIKELEELLSKAQNRKERAIAMAQLTKVGHIYVISNLGSFGENVYKIGMTRRLEPLDRVRELGDASVPFRFDVHALIYSENAPQLEYDIHQAFKNKRLNKTNYRREFFNVSLEEIEDFVFKHTQKEVNFVKLAEAREYRESATISNQLDDTLVSSIELNDNFPESLL
jgi:hypothetical protein